VLSLALPAAQWQLPTTATTCCCPDPSNCHCPDEHSKQHDDRTPGARACHRDQVEFGGPSVPAAAELATIEISTPVAAVTMIPPRPIAAPHPAPDPRRPAAPS